MFPPDLSDRFFEALYGDPEEGAYDIRLMFAGGKEGRLHFEFHLHKRPGKCLACHLTSGLPRVLERHPVINVKGLAAQIDHLLAGQGSCREWEMGKTRQISGDLHIVPLTVHLEENS